ncbi:hypothetical protein CAT7_08060 [Carnobacterium sp. AT7]|uniref:NUDIX hydrolase n=1 Tax=Carnobacterium TaxID=2747 RepID=UPI00015F3104|nr:MULTISPECIES: NUDIX hydrolase [Carnobacterium]EDP67533.1 hypothetical protein CAT7_08060 [Carnobacterium sp. AT7]
MEFEEKTLSSKTIYNGNLVDFVVDTVQLPNGGTSTRELIKHPGAVAIMAITADDKMIFVKQYRKAVEQVLLEIPAGKIDLTDENPIETGRRELEEETGYQAKTFELETSFYTSPGFANELIYIYTARELTKVEEPLAQDEDEFIELVYLTFDEAWEAYEKHLIYDAKTVYALLAWKLKLATMK